MEVHDTSIPFFKWYGHALDSVVYKFVLKATNLCSVSTEALCTWTSKKCYLCAKYTIVIQRINNFFGDFLHIRPIKKQSSNFFENQNIFAFSVFSAKLNKKKLSKYLFMIDSFLRSLILLIKYTAFVIKRKSQRIVYYECKITCFCLTKFVLVASQKKQLNRVQWPQFAFVFSFSSHRSEAVRYYRVLFQDGKSDFGFCVQVECTINSVYIVFIK